MVNRDEFNNYIVKQTNKYQKKYGFEIGTGVCRLGILAQRDRYLSGYWCKKLLPLNQSR